MILEVDFNSEEALYIQLRNQIIVGIATNRLKEGESLPGGLSQGGQTPRRSDCD